MHYLNHDYEIRIGKKIYRINAKIPVSPRKLVAALRDTEKLTEWNTTLTKHQIIEVNFFECCENVNYVEFIRFPHMEMS